MNYGLKKEILLRTPGMQSLRVESWLSKTLMYFVLKYSRDSFFGTLETRLSRRSIVPLNPTIEKPRNASTNCDETAVTMVDSTDQSNASPQTSLIRWEINMSRLYRLRKLENAFARFPLPYKFLYRFLSCGILCTFFHGFVLHDFWKA